MLFVDEGTIVSPTIVSLHLVQNFGEWMDKIYQWHSVRSDNCVLIVVMAQDYCTSTQPLTLYAYPCMSILL
jgi:hypothetical protein